MRPTVAPALRFVANVRDLGGHEALESRTLYHRFLRCGSTSSATAADLELLRDWGVRLVLDLRGVAESPALTCSLARCDWVRWRNVSLFDVDISSPALAPARKTNNYLVSSYLSMLSARAQMRAAFEFMAEAAPDECVLFHCAAGMDRTGMVAMLLLGLAGVGRAEVLADYCHSFASPAPVAEQVRLLEERGHVVVPKPMHNFAAYLLATRLDAIAQVYDTLVDAHGSIAGYLASCGITDNVASAVRAHLLVP